MPVTRAELATAFCTTDSWQVDRADQRDLHRSSLERGRPSDLGSHAVEKADNRFEAGTGRCLSKSKTSEFAQLLEVALEAVDRRGDRNEDDPTQVSGGWAKGLGAVGGLRADRSSFRSLAA